MVGPYIALEIPLKKKRYIVNVLYFRVWVSTLNNVFI